MISGLPVVVTEDAHISKELRDINCGIIVKGDESSLAAGIEKLIKSEDLRLHLGKNGKVYADNNYSWNKVAEDFKERFNLLLEE
jgi:glycosyltransferase involved in cell wall biosynthesis